MSRHTMSVAAAHHTAVPVRRRHMAVRVSGFVIDYLLALPIGCIAALIWVNTLPESYQRFAQAASFAVNNVGMVFFFGLIMKEVAEATLPGGVLHPWRRAALPAFAAAGGVVMAIACYRLFLRYAGEPMLEDGWVAACAIDIPVCYIIARWIFGRHPAVPFVLLLALSANGIGLVFLALGQPFENVNPAIGSGLMILALAGASGLRKLHVKSFWPYLLGPGAVSWIALFLGGLHPAFALVPIIPFLPHGRRDRGMFVEPSAQAHDTLTQFERWWRIPVEVVLLFFGLVNAGVPLHGIEMGAWAIPAAAIGRSIGILIAAGVAIAIGRLHIPNGMNWRDLTVVACTASTGLIFALFFASAVMPLGPLLLEMKMGALVTIAGGALAFAAARVLQVGRFAR